MATLRKSNQSRQAYTLVDINSIDDEELRKDIILDASEGGGIYGIRVVEESVNGAIRAPIYGYYNGTEFEDRWNDAKEKLGLAGEEVDDSEVRSTGPDVTDAEREAALREQAEKDSSAAAEAQRVAEEKEVAAVTGEASGDAAKVAKNKAPK
jgi:uncharacterized protein YuzE